MEPRHIARLVSEDANFKSGIIEGVQHYDVLNMPPEMLADMVEDNGGDVEDVIYVIYKYIGDFSNKLRPIFDRIRAVMHLGQGNLFNPYTRSVIWSITFGMVSFFGSDTPSDYDDPLNYKFDQYAGMMYNSSARSIVSNLVNFAYSMERLADFLDDNLVELRNEYDNGIPNADRLDEVIGPVEALFNLITSFVDKLHGLSIVAQRVIK